MAAGIAAAAGALAAVMAGMVQVLPAAGGAAKSNSITCGRCRPVIVMAVTLVGDQQA